MADDANPCLSPSEVLAWLDGTLPAERKAEIDQHLDACRLCEAAIEGVAGLGRRQDFIQGTDAVLARVRGRKAASTATVLAGRRRAWRPPRATPLLALAATVALAVGAGVVLTRPGPEELLFRRTFEPYPSRSPVVRGARAAGSTESMALYEAGDYRGALVGFEERLRHDPDDLVTRFYAGVCRLALGQAKEAAVTLEDVVEAGDEDLRAPAEWYLALARLRANDLPEARARLERVAAKDGFYRDRATALLRELNRLQPRS